MKSSSLGSRAVGQLSQTRARSFAAITRTSSYGFDLHIGYVLLNHNYFAGGVTIADESGLKFRGGTLRFADGSVTQVKFSFGTTPGARAAQEVGAEVVRNGEMRWVPIDQLDAKLDLHSLETRTTTATDPWW